MNIDDAIAKLEPDVVTPVPILASREEMLAEIARLKEENERLCKLAAVVDSYCERVIAESYVDRETRLDWNAAVLRGQELLDKEEHE